MYVSLAATTISTVFSFFWILTICEPVSYYWEAFINATGQCKRITDHLAVHYSHGAVSLAVDIVLGLIVPSFLLYNLQMKWQLKVSSGILLSVGSL